MEPRHAFPAARRWEAMLGRLRDVVRQEVLRFQLAEITGNSEPPLRVLDVGCGQGTQALHLARAGHLVTGLDVSAELLSRFEDALAAETAEVRSRVRLVTGTGEQAAGLAGSGFDLVLCHGVLMYLADAGPLLGALSQAAAGHGMISLLVRNRLALAMRPGLLGRWPEALDAFGGAHYVNRLGVRARAHTPEELDAWLEPLGWRRHRWFGVRVFTDHLDRPAPEPPELEQMIAAEREAGRRDPYRQAAALSHLVYRRVR